MINLIQPHNDNKYMKQSSKINTNSYFDNLEHKLIDKSEQMTNAIGKIRANYEK